MTTNITIRPVTFFLFFIVFITSACTRNNSTHTFINELPPTAATSIKSRPLIKENSSVTGVSLKIQYDTIWERLFSLYALPEIENDRIEKELQKYLKHPEYMVKIQQRAEPYLYFILDEIEAKQIPGELALLPAVESAFRPNGI
jgi:membrane-bound lytic murein transglycosylase D